MLVGNANTGCGRLDQILERSRDVVMQLRELPDHILELALLPSPMDKLRPDGTVDPRTTFPIPSGIIELVADHRGFAREQLDFAQAQLDTYIEAAITQHLHDIGAGDAKKVDLVSFYCIAPGHDRKNPIAKAMMQQGRALDNPGITQDDLLYAKPDMGVIVQDGRVYCEPCSSPLILATTKVVRYGTAYLLPTGEVVETRVKAEAFGEKTGRVLLKDELGTGKGFWDFTAARALTHNGRSVEQALARYLGLTLRKDYGNNPRKDGYDTAHYAGAFGVPFELQGTTFESQIENEVGARAHSGLKDRVRRELSLASAENAEVDTTSYILRRLCDIQVLAPERVYTPEHAYVPRPGVRIIGSNYLGIQQTGEGIYTPRHVAEQAMQRNS